MDSHRARRLYWEYCSTVAHIEVKTKLGDVRGGSAFHVGEGVFVTANHVVQDREVTAIEIERPGGYNILGDPLGPVRLALESQPVRHPEGLDVAAFRVSDFESAAFVPLGPLPSGWLAEGDWVMRDALVFGYPPIPNTPCGYLVVVQAQINALVNLRGARNRHFVLSATARGGFSGGLALADDGTVLGLVVRSEDATTLDETTQGATEEAGFMTVLSVGAIFECLAAAKLLPKCQERSWSDFKHVRRALIVYTEPEYPSLGIPVARITLFNDSNDTYLGIIMERSTLGPDYTGPEMRTVLAAVGDRVRTLLSGAATEEPDEGVERLIFRLSGRDDDANKAVLEDAREAALAEMQSFGFQVWLVPVDDS